jgi:glycosyltransferase involved in cell wall biosynthesis
MVTVSVVIISKDEPDLDVTLKTLAKQSRTPDEVVVVDASDGRLDTVRLGNPECRWIDFQRPDQVRVSIPHQRNAGIRASRGDVVAFTDAGCLPAPHWLEALVNPIELGNEHVTCGPARAEKHVYDPRPVDGYVEQCPTLNVAFSRQALEAVGPFDETFEYGSDLDFSWRLREEGFRLRWVTEAEVEHDWGTRRRQLKRSYVYGVARVRAYRKHPKMARELLRGRDIAALAYAAFVVGLPLTIVFPFYPLLLLVALYRNRASPDPLLSVASNLLIGLGLVWEATGLHRRRPLL